MKYLDLEFYKDFNCIGSECPYTCCGGGWTIIIDGQTDAFYQSVNGEMGDRLKKNITRKEGFSSFILTEKGNCPFLYAIFIVILGKNIFVRHAQLIQDIHM